MPHSGGGGRGLGGRNPNKAFLEQDLPVHSPVCADGERREHAGAMILAWPCAPLHPLQARQQPGQPEGPWRLDFVIDR